MPSGAVSVEDAVETNEPPRVYSSADVHFGPIC